MPEKVKPPAMRVDIYFCKSAKMVKWGYHVRVHYSVLFLYGEKFVGGYVV